MGFVNVRPLFMNLDLRVHANLMRRYDLKSCVIFRFQGRSHDNDWATLRLKSSLEV
jgi:hypothetical protein